MTDKSSEREVSPALVTAEDEGEVLEWTCHKAARDLRVTVVVSLVILAFALLVYYATDHSKTFTVLSLVILFASLSRFYLPIRYRLTDKRIMIKTPTQTTFKQWSLYRSCYPDKHGILLSPFTHPSRLESFRGIRLLFSDNATQVTKFVKKRIAGAPAESVTPHNGGQA